MTLWSHNDLRSDGGKKHLFGGTVQRAKSAILGQGARFTWVSINQFGQETSMVWMLRRHMGLAASQAKRGKLLENEMMTSERRHMRMRIWGAIAYR
jgi:hypothetical protein